MGAPPNHPFLDGIFHLGNHPFWDTSISGNLHLPLFASIKICTSAHGPAPSSSPNPATGNFPGVPPRRNRPVPEKLVGSLAS